MTYGARRLLRSLQAVVAKVPLGVYSNTDYSRAAGLMLMTQ
jgi:hypothetical protein